MFKVNFEYRNNTLNVLDGLELPFKMVGHCQIYMGNFTLVIYGGVTTFNATSNYNVRVNKAYIWDDHVKLWIHITEPSPCPASQQPLILSQQCVRRGSEEIIMFNQDFVNFTTCTCSLNIHTKQWVKLTATDQLPIGGVLLTGLNPYDVFYLGGYKKSKATANKTIYSLNTISRTSESKWTLTKMKLPYGMTAWDSIVIKSNLNLTHCSKDEAVWPRT